MTRHSNDDARIGSADRAAKSRRRGARSTTDLSRIISAQSEIACAGLDLQRVVDVITRRAQELTVEWRGYPQQQVGERHVRQQLPLSHQLLQMLGLFGGQRGAAGEKI